MVDEKARAFGLWEVKSLAEITQLSKQWSWSVPLWSLSSHPPCTLQWCSASFLHSRFHRWTPAESGGQVTKLRWPRGFEKDDDLDSAFLLLVEMLLALGFAKSQKDHWVSIISTCFKRGPSGFKNVFLVYDTVSEFLADKEPQCWMRPDSPWPVQAGLQAEALHHQAYFSLSSMVLFLCWITDTKPFHTSLCTNHQDLVTMQILTQLV